MRTFVLSFENGATFTALLRELTRNARRDSLAFNAFRLKLLFSLSTQEMKAINQNVKKTFGNGPLSSTRTPLPLLLLLMEKLFLVFILKFFFKFSRKNDLPAE